MKSLNFKQVLRNSIHCDIGVEVLSSQCVTWNAGAHHVSANVMFALEQKKTAGNGALKSSELYLHIQFLPSQDSHRIAILSGKYMLCVQRHTLCMQSVYLSVWFEACCKQHSTSDQA
jgi:hypothetical protein